MTTHDEHSYQRLPIEVVGREVEREDPIGEGKYGDDEHVQRDPAGRTKPRSVVEDPYSR